MVDGNEELQELSESFQALERDADTLKQTLRRGLLQVVRGVERSTSD